MEPENKQTNKQTDRQKQNKNKKYTNGTLKDRGMVYVQHVFASDFEVWIQINEY